MDVGLQPGPARKPIPLGNLELRLAHRTGVACFEQVFCLIFEMSEMGTIGKRAEKVRRIGRHSDPLSSKRPCPHFGLKGGSQKRLFTGGLLPFPRTGCALCAAPILSQQWKGTAVSPAESSARSSPPTLGFRQFGGDARPVAHLRG